MAVDGYYPDVTRCKSRSTGQILRDTLEGKLRLIRSLSMVVLGILLLAGGGTIAVAQEQDPLTSTQVEGFIASYPDAKRLAQQHGLDKRERPSSGPREEVFAGILEEMRAAGAYEDFDKLVQEHGFAAPEDWVGSANRIMMAYAVMAAEDAQGGVRMDESVAKQIAEARREIEGADMPADQKQMALSQLEAVAGQMKMFEVSEADRAAVRPYMTDLDRIVETE